MIEIFLKRSDFPNKLICHENFILAYRNVSHKSSIKESVITKIK